ncbi:MAG: hypothetical protein QOF48_2797, partial [Verrucomicrobiota bacterium]
MQSNDANIVPRGAFASAFVAILWLLPSAAAADTKTIVRANL